MKSLASPMMKQKIWKRKLFLIWLNAFANLQNGTTTRSNATHLKIVKESFINKEGEFKEQEQATRAIAMTILHLKFVKSNLAMALLWVVL